MVCPAICWAQGVQNIVPKIKDAVFTVYAEDGEDSTKVAEQAIREALEDADIIDADLDGFYEFEEVIT